ncbi:hypothetical protein BRD02_09490 [Halobacteriales archaeon QS_8_69_73]|nr:MAG: hypothetical protein BRD02_09490 [Halobacteriales archaeon QS_8_69_73]
MSTAAAADRPARTTAAGSVAVGVVATLGLGAATGETAVTAVGLAAGLALAGATRAATDAETAISGVLATLGGGLGVAGIAAVTLARVPWPPVLPIPFLPAAPFLLLLAGGLVGFGAAATAWHLRPAAAGRAAVAGTTVAAAPAAAGVIAAGGPPAAVLVAVVAAGLVAADRPALDGPAFVVGAGLVVPLAVVDDRLATVAVEAAADETRRQALVDTLTVTGPLGAVAGVVVAVSALAAGFLLAVRLAADTGLLGRAAGLQLVAAGTFLAAVASGITGTGVVVLVGVAAALLAWDLGEFAATLGREVGRGGASRRGEFVHVGGAVALAAVAVVAAVAAAGLVRTLSASGTPATVVAAAAAAVGTLLLLAALR